MPRTYLIFGDIEGKLDVLRVECSKCARKGRYHVHKLIAKYGRSGNMMKWKEQLNGDSPKRDAHSLHERCDLRCPDLSIPACAPKLKKQACLSNPHAPHICYVTVTKRALIVTELF